MHIHLSLHVHVHVHKYIYMYICIYDVWVWQQHLSEARHDYFPYRDEFHPRPPASRVESRSGADSLRGYVLRCTFGGRHCHRLTSPDVVLVPGQLVAVEMRRVVAVEICRI